MPIKLTDDFVRDNLPKIPDTAHKGDCGRLGVVAGSYGMAGAAALCINAAYRTGAGLVYGFVPDEIYPILAVMCPNAVFSPLGGAYELKKALDRPLNAVAIGCGMGSTAETYKAVRCVIEKKIPFVLDADGINSVAADIQLLKGSRCVITPHSGEAARILGCTPDDIERDRLAAVSALCEKSGATVVLKGHDTLISDGENTYLCPIGNSGMATAGSGDVLSGIIGTLLAQKLSPLIAAATAVYIHALAGDIAAKKLSRRSTCATDIISSLPDAFLHFQK